MNAHAPSRLQKNDVVALTKHNILCKPTTTLQCTTRPNPKPPVILHTHIWNSNTSTILITQTNLHALKGWTNHHTTCHVLEQTVSWNRKRTTMGTFTRGVCVHVSPLLLKIRKLSVFKYVWVTCWYPKLKKIFDHELIKQWDNTWQCRIDAIRLDAYN